jgi:hypothetical protein
MPITHTKTLIILFILLLFTHEIQDIAIRCLHITERTWYSEVNRFNVISSISLIKYCGHLLPSP